jgi:protein-L-isoaspartate(D-aspartate) O-methyltransferase
VTPQDWVDEQLRRRGIEDPRVLAAMARVPRELFVPDRARAHAYDDAALAIGYDQTISQPYVVACACQALALGGDERILDVGTGSGYQAAVLAELGSTVVSVERVPELAARARKALVAAGYPDVEVLVGDGSVGVPERAPFAAIAVGAAARQPPPSLLAQLEVGGRLVIPVGRFGLQRLVVIERTDEGLVTRRLADVRFVPLLGAEGVR